MAGLTKKDVKEVFKESLEPFAKAIQEDITRVNTKIGVEGMRIDNRLAKVELELRETRHDVQEVRTDVKWMKENSGELFKKLDDLISLLKRYEEQTTIMQEQIRRLEDRVAKLEGKRR